MRHNRSRRASSGSPGRRRTTWARGSGGAVFAAPGYQTFNLLNDYVAAGGPSAGVTVARTHLYLSFASAPAPGDVFGVGIIRGQNTDVGLNVVGAPRPITDEFEDWAYWEVPIASLIEVGSLTGAYYPWNIFRLDLKAMRKIPELQMSFNLVLQSTTGTDIVNWSASTLLMLP